jgi:hypothetical protein
MITKFEGFAKGKSWRALRLGVRQITHAKAQSTQIGKKFKWYLVE